MGSKLDLELQEPEPPLFFTAPANTGGSGSTTLSISSVVLVVVPYHNKDRN